MTVISLSHRLRKFENRHGYRGDVRQMSDQQLDALIRASYRDLRTEHGSLAQAVCHLRATGGEDSVALAILIEDDIESGRRPNEP
jgi:hypothetical protein